MAVQEHLASLKAAEAVARLGSLRAAADELRVTPGAVSQQIVKLEARLGQKLFTPQARGMVPNVMGEQLAANLTRGFNEIVRGLDPRDAATAHLHALEHASSTPEPLIVAAGTPFSREDCARLGQAADAVIERRCPGLTQAFVARGWSLPGRIDRIYDSAGAQSSWGWRPRHDVWSFLHDLSHPRVDAPAGNTGYGQGGRPRRAGTIVRRPGEGGALLQRACRLCRRLIVASCPARRTGDGALMSTIAGRR